MLKNAIKTNYYGGYGNILVSKICGRILQIEIAVLKTIQKPRRI